MSDNVSEILSKLIEISQIDLNYAQVLAEKNKLADSLKEKEDQCLKLGQQSEEVRQKLKKRQHSCSQQEQHIKAEQDKLTARRRSIASLNDFKSQQKAEKEIEHAAKQLSVQEDAMVELLDTVDALEKESSAAEEKAQAFQGELETLQSENNEAFQNLDERLRDYSDKRDELSSGIEPKSLNLYQRISERYLGTAVVPVDEGACSGCFFTLAPQVMVQIARAQSLVTCQSCGRILYHAPKEEQEKES